MSSTIAGLSGTGGWTAAAARPMPICGAASPHALGEGVDPPDPLHRGEQFLHDVLRALALGGQLEGACDLGEEWGAVLDDAGLAHPPAGLPHLAHLDSPESC
ncbi:hypothetical protein ACWGCI_16185 [Streptomyces sp. NPDC054949]